jgi:predicted alpha/beta hydrolase family esterase
LFVARQLSSRGHLYVILLERIHEFDIPETQTELIGELQDWFADVAENVDVPEENTIHRRLRPLWRAILGEK